VSCPYVRPFAFTRAALPERIFLKFDIRFFHENSIEKIRVCSKSDKDGGYLNEDLSTLCFFGKIQSPCRSLRLKCYQAAKMAGEV
jgi:hypothetical protein